VLVTLEPKGWLATASVEYEIDGYFENTIVVGKTYSIAELRQRAEVVKTHCTNKAVYFVALL
jgi:hypothetical protein